MRVFGDARRAALFVVEDEHSDRPRLPVPSRREDRLGDPLDGLAQSARDGLDLSADCEPRKAIVTCRFSSGNDPDALDGQLLVLPRGDGAGGRVGQAEAEKKA